MQPSNAPSGWTPPAEDYTKPAPPAADKPLDFASQAVPAPDFSSQAKAWAPPSTDAVVDPAPWQPPPGDKPLDFSAGNKLVSPAPDFSAGNVLASQTQTTTSPIAALRNSAGSIVSGIGHLGGEIDSTINKYGPAWLTGGATGPSSADQAVVNAGQAISGPQQYDGHSIHRLGSDLAHGRLGSAAYDATGALASAAPYAAAALTGPAGLATLGASGAGNTINAREQAQGESTPSLSDAGAGLVSGALNAAGGGLAHGVMSPAVAKLLGPLADRYAGRIAASGAAGAGLGAANQVLNTAGTGQMTGAGVANAAVEGAGTGALAGTAGGAVGALRQVMTERGAAALHPEEAASIARVADMAAAKAAGQSMKPADALAAIEPQLHGELQARVGELRKSGDIAPADFMAVVAPMLRSAAAGTLKASDGNIPSSALAQFDTLPLPSADAAMIRRGALDLSTMNADGKNRGGLVQGTVNRLVSNSAARTAEMVAGSLVGNHVGGLEGALAGGMTGMAIPWVAGKAAAGVDAMLGANVPPAVRNATMAALALKRAGMEAGPSSLEALQAARQAGASNDGTPTPESIGQERAAANQAAFLSKYGPEHPIGRAAATALAEAGRADLAARALAQFNAMAPVRNAKAEAVAHDTAAGHQANLDAAEITPGGNVSIEAINAAANQLSRRAQATLRLAGKGGGDGYTADSGKAEGGGNSNTAEPGTPAAPSDAAVPGVAPGLMGLADHLSSRSLWGPAGVALTPDELRTGLDAAAGAGAITPEQHATLGAHLASNTPLHHTGGAADAALNAVVQHALAAKLGGDVAPGGPIDRPAAGVGGAAVDSPAIYSPVRYNAAVAANQSALASLATDSDPQVRDLANTLRTTKGVAARTDARDAVVSSKMLNGDVIGAARVKALFHNDLLQAGDKTK